NQVFLRNANGRDAIAFAERLQPDVILMDLYMPDENGILSWSHGTGEGNLAVDSPAPDQPGDCPKSVCRFPTDFPEGKPSDNGIRTTKYRTRCTVQNVGYWPTMVGK
ncbi:MAG: hypothetical protein KDE29_23830, partial [Anaerolineales bacterium]|nr:hypothetical protein [Anaerolineales bacterium]